MRRLVSIVCLAISALATAPAFADLAAFNKAVLAGDYRTAAAEAASAWPTLDPSSSDFQIIAREFGWAAFQANDFAQARTYAQAAAADPKAGAPDLQLQTVSNVLLRLAEHKLNPAKSTRKQLASSLAQRAAQPGVDLISYTAAQALLSYDIDAAAWKDGRESSALAVNLNTAGGARYHLLKLRSELYRAVIDYQIEKDAKIYHRLNALVEDVVREIDAAPSDEQAAPALGLYWQARAWLSAIQNQIGVGALKSAGIDTSAEGSPPSDRYRRLIADRTEGCRTRIKMKTFEYPPSGIYKGMQGVVIMRIDIDAKGKVHDPRIITAVPANVFGDSAIKNAKGMDYSPGETWDKTCTLERKDQLVEFFFQIR